MSRPFSASRVALTVAGTPLMLVYCFADRAALRTDAARWREIKFQDPSTWYTASDGPALDVAFMGARYAEFRSLLYYRAREHGAIGMVLGLLFGLFAKGAPGMHLRPGSLGPGFYIEHGTATIVSCVSWGRDGWLNQQATVGFGSDGEPTIGDRVAIRAGAKVYGNITIGDNVHIGANAVVAKDVAANTVVGGVPARVIATVPPLAAKPPIPARPPAP